MIPERGMKNEGVEKDEGKEGKVEDKGNKSKGRGEGCVSGKEGKVV